MAAPSALGRREDSANGRRGLHIRHPQVEKLMLARNALGFISLRMPSIVQTRLLTVITMRAAVRASRRGRQCGGYGTSCSGDVTRNHRVASPGKGVRVVDSVARKGIEVTRNDRRVHEYSISGPRYPSGRVLAVHRAKPLSIAGYCSIDCQHRRSDG